MKKFICLIASLAGLLTVSEAQADNFYVGGFAGPNWITNQKDSRTGWLAGVDIGYRWCNGFRTEIEYSYRHVEGRRRHHHEGASADSGDYSRGRRNFHSNAILFNVLYDFDTCYCVRPFIGGGIGWADQKSNRRHFDENGEEEGRRHHRKSGFGWQFIAGLAYPFTDCIDLEVSYRLFKVENNRNHNNGKGYSNGLAFGVNLRW